MWPFRNKDLTPDWARGLPDPPVPGSSERAVAAAKPSPPVTGPQISGRSLSVPAQLHSRGQP